MSGTKAHAKMGVNFTNKYGKYICTCPSGWTGKDCETGKFSVSWLVTFIIIMTMTYCSEKAKQTYQFGGVVLGQLHLFFDLELTVSYLLYDTLLKLAVHEQGNVYVVEIFLIELEQCGC